MPFQRVTTANEEIVEVLLSKNQLLSALRFLRSVGGADNASGRKFLEAAKNADDRMLFFTVYKFFEQRNIRLRGNPQFMPGWWNKLVFFLLVLHFVTKKRHILSSCNLHSQ